MWNNVKIRLYVGVGILLVVVISLAATKVITISEGINLIILIGLVAVTAIYAGQTGEIARETRKQAEASVKIAEEASKQRIIDSRPIIIQKVACEKDILERNTEYFSHFEILSVGHNPAIELEISIRYKEKVYLPKKDRRTYLRADDPPIKFDLSPINNPDENKSYEIICEYQDIFSDPKPSFYQTRLPFKIEKTNIQNKIIIKAGELVITKIQDNERINIFNSKGKPQ